MLDQRLWAPRRPNAYREAKLALRPFFYAPVDEIAGAMDIVGNRVGTRNGTITTVGSPVIGSLGYAPKLDGSTGYITWPDEAGFSINPILSVEVLAVITGSAERGIVSKAAGSQYEWRVYSDSGSLIVQVLQLDGGAVLAQVAPAISSGLHSIGAVFDDTNDVLEAWIDGVLAATDATWTGSPANGTGLLNLGRSGDGFWFHDSIACELSLHAHRLTGPDFALLARLRQGQA